MTGLPTPQPWLQSDLMSCLSDLTFKNDKLQGTIYIILQDMVAKYFSCTFPFFKYATNLYLLGIMHAAPPLARSPLASSYSSKKCLAKISIGYFTKLFTIYFYCSWVDDVSFQSPLVRPCTLLGTLSIVQALFVQ